MPDDDSGLRIPPRSQQIGPFAIFEDETSLQLRFKERGGAIVQRLPRHRAVAVYRVSVRRSGDLSVRQRVCLADDPNTERARRSAHHKFSSRTKITSACCGFFSAFGVLVAIPFYVARTYRSTLVYTFRRSDDVLLRNNRIITQLRRIERVVIEEAADPDGRFLYDLALVYADGLELSLHTGYDEREVKNLANEISKFIGVQISWREETPGHSRFNRRAQAFMYDFNTVPIRVEHIGGIIAGIIFESRPR